MSKTKSGPSVLLVHTKLLVVNILLDKAAEETITGTRLIQPCFSLYADRRPNPGQKRITKENKMATKKIIAVVGATGSQGSGLVRAILEDKKGDFPNVHRLFTLMQYKVPSVLEKMRKSEETLLHLRR